MHRTSFLVVTLGIVTGLVAPARGDRPTGKVEMSLRTRLIGWTTDAKRVVVHETTTHPETNTHYYLRLIDFGRSGKPATTQIHDGDQESGCPGSLAAVQKAAYPELKAVRLVASDPAPAGYQGKIERTRDRISLFLLRGATKTKLGEIERSEPRVTLLGLEWGPGGKAVAFKLKAVTDLPRLKSDSELLVAFVVPVAR